MNFLNKMYHIKWILTFILSTIFLNKTWAHVNTPESYRIELTIQEVDRVKMQAPVSTKVEEAWLKIFFEGQLQQETKVEFSTRGFSSLKEFPRKNLNLKVREKEVDLKIGQLKNDHFLLTAGPEDELLIKNRFAFKAMELAQVTHLKTKKDMQVVELVINGQSEGLYLITLPPAEILLKSDNEIVFRRRYNDDVELKKAKKDLSNELTQAYEQKLREIHNQVFNLKGKDLADYLEKSMNIRQYMRWHMINFLIKNGDFSDEVFFVGSQKEGEIYFEIEPWDMDDVFAEGMHLAKYPGTPNSFRARDSQRQLLNGFESRLDLAISSNEFLLEMYFEEIEKFMTTQSENILPLLDLAVNELAPYIDDQDIQANGLKDAIARPHSKALIADSVQAKLLMIQERLSFMKNALKEAKTYGVKDRVKKISIFRKFFFIQVSKIMRKMSKKE